MIAKERINIAEKYSGLVKLAIKIIIVISFNSIFADLRKIKIIKPLNKRNPKIPPSNIICKYETTVKLGFSPLA